VNWYCSEPRLAFNRTVVLRYRIYLEQRHLAIDGWTQASGVREGLLFRAINNDKIGLEL
jgi:hypothetical protein